MHLKVEEKITLEANRDGGLEHMEVRGTMWLIISKAECDKVQVKIEKDDSKGLLFQVNMTDNRRNISAHYFSDAPQHRQESIYEQLSDCTQSC